MPRILTRQNAVLTDESQYATKQAQIQTEQDAQRNTKLDTANASLTTANTNLVNLKNQQDGIIGALNNTTIGDGQLGQRTYVYAHDTAAGQGRALKCDSSGRLECSVDALEVTAETINLNTDTLETLIGTTNTKIQTDLDFAGQPNAIGDGSNMKRVMNYGHDSAGGQQRPLLVDSTGMLKVVVASGAGSATAANQTTQIGHLSEIEGAVENVELTVGTNAATAPTRSLQIGGKYVDGTFRDIKVDNIGKVIIDSPSGSDINTRIDAISNAQTQNGDGTGNKPGVMLDAVNTNIISLNNKFVGGQTTSGMATAQNQQVVDLTLQGIDTILGNIQSAQTQDGAGNGNKPGVMLDAINTNTITQNGKIDITNGELSGLNLTVGSVQVPILTNIQNAQTQDGAGGGNKPGVMLDAINTNTITQNSKIDTTNSHLSTLAGAVSGSEVQVDVVSMPTTTVSDGGGSLTVDNSVLTSLNSAINSNRVDVNIANGGFDGAVTNSALTELAAAINSNRVDVNIANGGFDGAVTNSALTELAAAINSNRVDVNIANGGFDGAVTNSALTELAAAINSNKVDVNIASNAVDFATQTTLAAAEAHLGNIETSVQTLDDVVKAEDAAHSGGDKGIMALSVRKDTATNLAGSDADYQPLITGSAGHLHVNDSHHHRVKDVAFLTTESISSNSMSSTTLDTEGYSSVNIYGETTGGTTTSGSTELKVMGSNSSSGTYYSLSGLQASNFISGRSMVNSLPANVGDALGNQQRYIKIYNNTAGTIELTLRAVMSNFNTYV